MNIVVSADRIQQPPLLSFNKKGDRELTVAIAGLALGGAERIVLDWATRIYPTWSVHLIVLRDNPKEWPVPDFIKVTRLHNKNVVAELERIGKKLAKSANPICLCHLLRKTERDALAANSACIVPVLHNARAGWLEDTKDLDVAPYVIGVSNACIQDLVTDGWHGYGSVIHHLPCLRKFPDGIREHFRTTWNIPQNAIVIGMIGAMKPQKDYQFALRLLSELHQQRDAYLVIIGGPIGARGWETWKELVHMVRQGLSGIRPRVALPGFIPDAGQCLPAFDILLNTSKFEGLSMATLEALANGIPVVAREAGGQGEVACDSLTIVPRDATSSEWIDAIMQAIDSHTKPPRWARFPSYRLWTLAQLARPVKDAGKVLFVTANLNSGGAQRSLVNLTVALGKRLRFEIAVAGDSTSDYFFRQLKKSGISVFRSASSRDAFDQAEALAKKICTDGIGTVCFWNLDSKIKFLLAKSLYFTNVRLVDVSPGNNSFDEIDGSIEFQEFISFDRDAFYRRLDTLVLKFDGPYPSACAVKTEIIPNGVRLPRIHKTDYAIRNATPRIVVSGRIAPTKFVLEIVQAMQSVWNAIPKAELHVFGSAEPRHRDYAETVFMAAGEEINSRIFFHGPQFEIASHIWEFDAYVVLAKEQGCPNALLEALAAGVPSIANDDGGTKEQIINRKTGLLVGSIAPEELAHALIEILNDRNFAQQVGQAGRQHVEQHFSMRRMVDRYVEILGKNNPQRNSLVSSLRHWKQRLWATAS